MAAAPEKTVLAEDGSIFTISNLLTPGECADLIQHAEARTFEPGLIGGFLVDPEARNNRLVMEDDTARASWLWERLAPFLPERVGDLRAIGLNERLRYYRYEPGQYFRWHSDGSFVRSSTERSLLTAMVYLNDDFEGGTTDFMDGPTVAPQRGMALIFDHPLIHQGGDVISGRKYVIRTDVMFRRE